VQLSGNTMLGAQQKCKRKTKDAGAKGKGVSFEVAAHEWARDETTEGQLGLASKPVVGGLVLGFLTNKR
jgi:hypothetical protein